MIALNSGILFLVRQNRKIIGFEENLINGQSQRGDLWPPPRVHTPFGDFV
jgi:hypothetical protein